jgi:hypothetical protein
VLAVGSLLALGTLTTFECPLRVALTVLPFALRRVGPGRADIVRQLRGRLVDL